MILTDKLDLLHVEKVHLAQERCNKSCNKKRRRENSKNKFLTPFASCSQSSQIVIA